MNVVDKLTAIVYELQKIQNNGRWDGLAEIQSRIPQIMTELAQTDAPSSMVNELIEAHQELQGVQNDLRDSSTSMIREMVGNFSELHRMMNAQRLILGVIAGLARMKKSTLTISQIKPTLN